MGHTTCCFFRSTSSTTSSFRTSTTRRSARASHQWRARSTGSAPSSSGSSTPSSGFRRSRRSWTANGERRYGPSPEPSRVRFHRRRGVAGVGGGSLSGLCRHRSSLPRSPIQGSDLRRPLAAVLCGISRPTTPPRCQAGGFSLSSTFSIHMG